jgi:hypothetical protein
VYTDHNNLRWLLDAKWSSGKLARWALRLAEYDMVIHHTKGALNAAADALSRYPLWGRPAPLAPECSVPPAPSLDADDPSVLGYTRQVCLSQSYDPWSSLDVSTTLCKDQDTYCTLASNPLALVIAYSAFASRTSDIYEDSLRVSPGADIPVLGPSPSFVAVSLPCSPGVSLELDTCQNEVRANDPTSPSLLSWKGPNGWVGASLA